MQFQSVTDEADAAIRRTREHASNWWEGRRALAEAVPHLVAHAVVSSQGPGDGGDPAGVIGELLRRRGQEAHNLVAGRIGRSSSVMFPIGARARTAFSV